MEKFDYQGVPDVEGKPYENLFIYLLEGYVNSEDEKILGNNFLGNWVEGEYSFLFFSNPAGKRIINLLDYRQNLKLVDEYHFSYEEWQGGLPETIQIENFLIVSPWTKSIPEFEGIRIWLDPGVVFGNGLHPTTRDCLKALRLTHQQQPFKEVLDLGTGTGVLSIAAAQLGAEKITAVDLNPLCIRTAVGNVERNNLDHIIKVTEARAEDLVDEPADLVMANIHHAVIKSLIDNRKFKRGERIIISGLMRSQFREIKDQLISKGFSVLKTWDHEMIWFTALGMKSEE